MQFLQRSILLMLFGISFSFLQAQEYLYDIHHISGDEGLLNNEVLNIIQDQEGFIWINTPGTISKYDGYNFTNYDSKKLKIGIKSAVDIAIDKANNLWYFEKGVSQPNCYILETETDSIIAVNTYTNGVLDAAHITSVTPSQHERGMLAITTTKGEIFSYGSSLNSVYKFNFNYNSSFLSCHQVGSESYWILDEGRAFLLENTKVFPYGLPNKPLEFISAKPNVILKIHDTPTRFTELVDLSLIHI